MKKNLISIIVPIYNSSKTLDFCINSLLNQTYKNIEVILVNDGSTDNSLDICNKYSKLDRKIKVINKENGGVSSARNAGLAVANGNYIGFVDSDDYIEKNMYEELFNTLKKNNSKIAICNIEFKNEYGTTIKEFSHDNVVFGRDELPLYMFNVLCINGYLCNKLYSRELIFINNDYIKFDETIRILEDNLFNYEIFNKNRNFTCTYLNKKLYNYIQFKNNTSNKKYDLSKLQYFLVREKQINILDNNNIDSNFLKIDYIVNFKKDDIKISILKIKKNNLYFQILAKRKKYLNEINCKNISKRLKIKYIICKKIPIIYKLFIILKKENI